MKNENEHEEIEVVFPIEEIQKTDMNMIIDIARLFIAIVIPFMLQIDNRNAEPQIIYTIPNTGYIIFLLGLLIRIFVKTLSRKAIKDVLNGGLNPAYIESKSLLGSYIAEDQY